MQSQDTWKIGRAAAHRYSAGVLHEAFATYPVLIRAIFLWAQGQNLRISMFSTPICASLGLSSWKLSHEVTHPQDFRHARVPSCVQSRVPASAWYWQHRKSNTSPPDAGQWLVLTLAMLPDLRYRSKTSVARGLTGDLFACQHQSTSISAIHQLNSIFSLHHYILPNRYHLCIISFRIHA